jgi:hypothetical protein
MEESSNQCSKLPKKTKPSRSREEGETGFLRIQTQADMMLNIPEYFAARAAGEIVAAILLTEANGANWPGRHSAIVLLVSPDLNRQMLKKNYSLIILSLVAVAERSKACTVFARSEAGTVESHSRHGCLVFVYVRFSVFVYR